MKIFPELQGFSVFSPELLAKEIKKYSVGRDLLKSLRQYEFNKKLTDNRVIVPINNIEEKFYKVKLQILEGGKTPHIQSRGTIAICGIGYLSDFSFFDLKQNKKIITYKVPKGEYELHYHINSKKEEMTIALKKVEVV